MIEYLFKKGGFFMPTKEDREWIIKVYQEFYQELDKVLIGQEKVKRAVAASMLCSNCKLLFSGNSGLGKTTLGVALRNSLNSIRISMLADLNASEIQEILIAKENLQLLYMDEFNRVNGRTLSGLNELLEENQITFNNKVYPYPNLYVFASQNIEEFTGIFTVPYAIYDRFDMEIIFENLTKEEKDALIFDDFSASTKLNFDFSQLERVRQVVDSFKPDISLLSNVVDEIDAMQFGKEKIFTNSNIRAHRFTLKLAKLMALANGRTNILSSDYAEFLSYIYVHRISPQLARDKNSKESIQQKFINFEDQVLRKKRKLQIFNLKEGKTHE